MARSIGSGPGRSNNFLMLTCALVSVLLILVYVYWSKTSFIRQLRDENDNGNRALQKALADVKTLQDRVNQLDEELASIAHEKTELENKQKGLTSQVEECNKKLVCM